MALAVERGVVLAAAAFALFAWLAPATIVGGDNAELSTLAVTGGAAHPSGYPLYVLWLRAFSWLPGSAAHAAALATALVAAATILILHAAARAWGARPLAATGAALLFASGPVVLRLSSQAEVFALNNLAVAAVLWLAAKDGPGRGAVRVGLLGLVAGLGMSDHLTCTLIAPVGLLGIVRGVRESALPKLGCGLLGAAGLALGLTSYLYLLVAPASAASWGQASSLGDVLGFITRRDYGGIGSFSPEHGEVDMLANLGALAATLGRGLLWLPALLGVGALAVLAVRPADASPGASPVEPRAGWRALAVSWFLAGPFLIARFNIAPVMIGRFICERFHVLPLLLLVVPLALSLDRGGAWLARHLSWRPLGAGLHATIALVGLVGAAAPSLGAVQATASPAVEASARNTLRPLPPGAVILVGADDLHFGVLYAQETLGERRDVTVVAVQMVWLPWYRDRLAARGIVVTPTGSPAELGLLLARQLLAQRHPLFVDLLQEQVRAQLPTYPLGTLFRVVPTGAPLPPLDEVLAENRAALASFDFAYPVPGPDDGYPTGVQGRYVAAWSILAHQLARAGRGEDAQQAAAVVDALSPR